MLYKQNITLKAYRVIAANGGSLATCKVGWNGFRLDNASLYENPQVTLFNQYAGMFEYYQVTQCRGTFVPLKWEFKSTTNEVVTYPVVSIIDPDDQAPLTPDQYFAYGNAHWTKPYEPHSRSMVKAMNLMLQKQDKQLMKTNGSWASREQYTDPAQICWTMNGQTRTPGDQCAVLMYEISYVFSGQKQVGSSFQSSQPPPPPPPVVSLVDMIKSLKIEDIDDIERSEALHQLKSAVKRAKE